MKTLRFGPRAFALPALGLAAAIAGTVPALAETTSRPFKASFTTHETLAPNPAACPAAFPFLQGKTAGSGIATHLGRTQLVATDCISLPSPSGSFTFTDGKLSLTAANGDTLTATYSGTLSPTPGSPDGTLAGNYRITGGTGRFAGATGAGYLTGTLNLLTGQGTMNAAGTIGY